MKTDNSANLYQKCLILCSKTRQYELKSFVTMATYWVSDLPNILKFLEFLATFNNCKWCLVCMIQQAYKYFSSRLWTRLAFFELKITYILKSNGWGLAMSELPWEKNALQPQVCFLSNINLPSFNGIHCNVAKIALFTYLI